MRRRGRTDATQQAMVAALRQAGATVVSLADVGDGCPDLLVGWGGQAALIECKAHGGRLTARQHAFHAAWRGPPIAVLSSVDAVGVWIQHHESRAGSDRGRTDAVGGTDSDD